MYSLWTRFPESLRNVFRKSYISKRISRWLMDFDSYLSLDDKDFTTRFLTESIDLQVDVVVTSYRQSNYLEQCMESILSQKAKISSITLVNHCPEEAEVKNFDVAARPYLDDDRIKVLHLEECWPGFARNKGAAVGNSPYLVFIDVDDWISSAYLENALLAAAATESDFAGAECEVFSENGSLGVWQLKRMPTIKDLITSNAFPVGSVIKRKSFEKLGGWNDYDDEGVRQDEAINFWRRALLTGMRGTNVRQQLIHLRRHTANLSTVENSLTSPQALKKSFKNLQKNSPKPGSKTKKRQYSIPSFSKVVLGLTNYRPDPTKKTVIFLVADGTMFGAGKVTKYLIDQCLSDNLNVIVLNCDYRSQGAPLAELVNVLWIEFGAITPRLLWLQTLQMWLSEINPEWVISTGHPDVDLLVDALKKRGTNGRFATTMFNTQSLHSSLIIEKRDVFEKILVESEFSRSWLLENKIETQRIGIIRHLAHRTLNGGHKALDEIVSVQALTVGWFHRFSPEKQPLEFVKICQSQQAGLYNFVMGGTGPLRRKIEKQSNDGKMKFLSEIISTNEFLSTADISIMTSSEVEGRPLAVLEALEAGKVVLANKVGALSEMAELGYVGLFLFGSTAEMISFLNTSHALLVDLKKEVAGNLKINRGITDEYVTAGTRLAEMLEL